MDMHCDIHNYQRRLDGYLRRIQQSPEISKQNKYLILQFKGHCLSHGLSIGRVVRYLFDLQRLSGWLGKDFDQANKADIEQLMAHINTTNYSQSTKRDFGITLRKLYKWLRGTEQYPDEVRWIRTSYKTCNEKLPEDLLTEEEVKRLIACAGTLRNKAFIAALYETGCRIGELLPLRIKNVQIFSSPLSAVLLVSGKTGSRRIRIVSAVPYLTDHLNSHPRREQPDAFVWEYRGKDSVSYTGMRTMIEKAASVARIKKKINFHNFRHSRATFIANHFTEAQMDEYFGWIQGSNMPSIYVHLSGRDVDNAVFKLYGLNPNGNGSTGEAAILKPIFCPRCNLVGKPTDKYCSGCSMVLDKETMLAVVKNDMDRNRSDTILDQLLHDEEFKALFAKKLNQLTAPKS